MARIKSPRAARRTVRLTALRPLAAGLAKLGELTIDPEDPTVVRTPCGAPHDDLVGMLLPRAINVRAALRELEESAARGVLVAPSAQESVQP